MGALTAKEMEIMGDIYDELDRAEKLHPNWPDDTIHAAAIVCEECGELIRAALNIEYSNENLEKIREEAIHAAATAIRLLKNL